MKFGLQLYTVREFMKTRQDFAGTMKKLSAMGFKHLHVSGMPEIIPVEEVAETSAAYELRPIMANVSSQRILKETSAVIAEHKMMTAKYIGLSQMPKDYERTRDGFRRFCTDFIPAAREIKKAGLQLIYHNHHIEFEKFEGIYALDFLAEYFKDINFAFNTYWMQMAGADAADWIKRLGSRVEILHMKDCTVVDGAIRMCAVMEGNLNWARIMEAAEESEVKYGFVGIDETFGEDPFDILRSTLRKLKNEYGHIEHVLPEDD